MQRCSNADPDLRPDPIGSSRLDLEAARAALASVRRRAAELLREAGFASANSPEERFARRIVLSELDGAPFSWTLEGFQLPCGRLRPL